MDLQSLQQDPRYSTLTGNAVQGLALLQAFQQVLYLFYRAQYVQMASIKISGSQFRYFESGCTGYFSANQFGYQCFYTWPAPGTSRAYKSRHLCFYCNGRWTAFTKALPTRNLNGAYLRWLIMYYPACVLLILNHQLGKARKVGKFLSTAASFDFTGVVLLKVITVV